MSQCSSLLNYFLAQNHPPLLHLHKSGYLKVFRRRPSQNIPPPRRPASENLQGTKAREGARIRPCHALSYGDLTAGGPQLRSAARVSRAVRISMEVGSDGFL
jgi:hypothetical protein